MNDRFVMRFSGKMTTFAEDELNKFLDANPDYRIACMTYVNQSSFYYGIIAYFERIDNSTINKTTVTINTTTVADDLDDLDDLKEYKDLYDSGIISQEEFERMKKQLLGL